MAIAGTEELYVGRRMASRILASTSIRTLASLTPEAPMPDPGSRAELDLARRATDALAAILGPEIERLHPWTVDPPDRRRPLRRSLTGLFLGPGRVDRS
jgi:hypothetical protein